MAHEAFEQKVHQLVDLFQGDMDGFLTAFSPIHVTWHARRGAVVGGALLPIGFLTFHHTAVVAYKRMLRSINQRMPPPFAPGYNSAIESVGDPARFSQQVEDWHNSVHNSDMTLMNPATNIFRPRFWGLHGFIDRKFMRWQRVHRKITSSEHRTV